MRWQIGWPGIAFALLLFGGGLFSVRTASTVSQLTAAPVSGCSPHQRVHRHRQTAPSFTYPCIRVFISA